jgi:hypothetical protein
MVWSNLWAITRFRVLYLIAVFVVVVFVGWVGRLASGDPSATPDLGALVVVGIALLVPGSVYWGTVQAYRKLKPEQLRKEFRFSSSALSVEDGLSRGDIAWQAIPKVVETDRALLLFLQDHVYHLVPRRAFASPADLTTARHILKAALGERAQLKPDGPR